MAPTPKHDYSNPEFHKKIEGYSAKGYTDKEIAIELDLSPTYFSELKTEHIGMSEALARGRAKINMAVRQQYLAASLGQVKKKTVTRKLPSKHDGEEFIDVDGLVVYETTEDGVPNLQGLGNWLFNHDEEWRQKTIEGKRLDVTTNGENINNPLVFVSAEDLSDDQLNKLIDQQLGTDGDSSNDTGT